MQVFRTFTRLAACACAGLAAGVYYIHKCGSKMSSMEALKDSPVEKGNLFP